MLDFDLAELYGVSTSRLNEQVTRNRKRFPEDFMFRLTKKETEILRSHFVISRSDLRSENAASKSLRSQFAISNVGRGGPATPSLRIHRAGSGNVVRCAEQRSGD